MEICTLAAVAAIEEMGGPTIPWRPGRQDKTAKDCTPDGRLPDGDKGAGLEKLFIEWALRRPGNYRSAGAHAVGKCHPDRSGFDGPWTRSPTTLPNQYYKDLLNTKWTRKNGTVQTSTRILKDFDDARGRYGVLVGPKFKEIHRIVRSRPKKWHKGR